MKNIKNKKNKRRIRVTKDKTYNGIVRIFKIYMCVYIYLYIYLECKRGYVTK
jgi:hypothetical protein